MVNECLITDDQNAGLLKVTLVAVVVGGSWQICLPAHSFLSSLVICMQLPDQIGRMWGIGDAVEEKAAPRSGITGPDAL